MAFADTNASMVAVGDTQRRRPSRGGTSRMTRECQVRFCERLGVKFLEPTRRPESIWPRPAHSRFTSNCGLTKYDAGTALSCQKQHFTAQGRR
jgi:hypothetical protein